MGEEEKIATAQRQRSILLYRELSEIGKSVDVKLADHSEVTAKQLFAVDSSESKFVLEGVTTDWGTYKEPVTLRGGDIVYIDVRL
jgi:hypothetical protein